ncbi:MAG: hypothetical protein P4L85_08925 [Paludisphaera borealis]|uniref:hypothetical protein n=1 Tax=Paludisphaera borealis TaxID=1387353 RepID=UPI00284274C5|nr:hypothetical protein [Paludisphaera borealis]MDR3619460.1 hypothetical protein [Paludisphaera borealis]
MNASESDRGKLLIEGYGLRLADHSDITAEILNMMNARGEAWSWVERWIAEDAPRWRNTPDTLVFEVPPGRLADRQAVDFTQDVWMCKPQVFEHQTWGGRTFVRMSWSRAERHAV